MNLPTTFVRPTLGWLPALLLALVAAGCDPEHPCDPGQTYVRNACIAPQASDAGAATDGRADGGDGGAGDAGLCADPYYGFGQACKTAADCPCATDFCVDYGSYNFCTRKGCLDQPSICPASWFCIDTSLYQPGGPAICFKS